MAPPKVFISYSHDSPAHEAKVLALADRLRSNGIDAVLDQYESFPARGWIQWMKDQVRDAQFVLVVCTETYKRRWDGEEAIGVGLGATFEGQTLQQILYDAAGVNERFVPILLEKNDDKHIPLELRKHQNFRPHTNDSYLNLYRLLTNQPKVKKPIVGKPLLLQEAKPDFRNSIWNVPPRNVFFTGRAKQLEDVRKALAKGAAAISGIGGMGKTQTAIEYAYVYRGEYRVVLWSLADSRDALISGFAAFAQVLDLPQKDEKDLTVVAAAVRGWLESNSGWLLILDNVEDFAPARICPRQGAGARTHHYKAARHGGYCGARRAEEDGSG